MEQNKEQALLDELVKRGSLGILATGYRGIMLWKEKRPKVVKVKKKDAAEKKS
jgi:hypothetical protein